jgi:predicted transcriptional regulator
LTNGAEYGIVIMRAGNSKQKEKGENKMGEKEKIWDYLVENMIATDEELKLVTCINGYNEESLNAVLYARTGYRDIEQLTEED